MHNLKLKIMKNFVELITSNEWNALSKEQRIDELQRQIDGLKNETEYPVFCLSINNTNLFIVKFDGLTSGEVVKQGANEIGFKIDNFIAYTSKEDWKPLPYNKERGLYHTQLVWCWDYSTHSRRLGFYDAINDRSFDVNGRFHGSTWKNYEPFQGEWPQWAIEAHKTLEGLND